MTQQINIIHKYSNGLCVKKLKSTSTFSRITSLYCDPCLHCLNITNFANYRNKTYFTMSVLIVAYKDGLSLLLTLHVEFTLIFNTSNGRECHSNTGENVIPTEKKLCKNYDVSVGSFAC